MRFKNSWEKIMFAFDSRVVIKMVEREQRGLMELGIMDDDMAWYYIHM
jgi:alpha-galactosidase